MKSSPRDVISAFSRVAYRSLFVRPDGFTAAIVRFGRRDSHNLCFPLVIALYLITLQYQLSPGDYYLLSPSVP